MLSRGVFIRARLVLLQGGAALYGHDIGDASDQPSTGNGGVPLTRRLTAPLGEKETPSLS